MDPSVFFEHAVTVEYQDGSGRDSGGGTELAWTTRETGVACLLNVGSGAGEQERFSQQGLIGTVIGATTYTGVARGDRLTVTAGPTMVGKVLRLTGLKQQPGVEFLGIPDIVHFSGEFQE